MSHTRPHWDAVWEDVAAVIASRSLCVKSQVGAVITDRHNRVVSTGYNGPAAGFAHGESSCEYWCPRAGAIRTGFSDGRCLSVHAEANALLSGDRSSWAGGTMYVTKHPCWECAKLIANSGLTRLVVIHPPEPEEHHSHETYAFLDEIGIVVEVTNDD